MRNLLTLVVFLLLAPGAYAQTPGGQPPLPTVQLQTGMYLIKAEVANDFGTRMQGLMMREKMAPNEGMLFIFPSAETQCMWMKNTLIDLDVAFADESGKILNVAQMKAGTSDIHCSKGNAKLALEMNLNWFSKNGVNPGEVMQIPESTRATKQ